MALISEESKDLLQAQAELYNQVFSYMKSVALAVALDLRIADAIHHHGGAATIFQIAGEIGVNPCKIPRLRRLMRALTVAGIFTIQPSDEQTVKASSAGHEPAAVYKLTTASRILISKSSPSLFPTLSQQLNSFRDSVLSMGLSAWFQHDEQPGPCPFTLRHGITFWEKSERDHAANASFNNSMAADSHFLMQVALKEFSEIFHGMGSLVDVGGGVGGAAISIAAAFPCMKCSVLDLPHVVAKAPSASASNNVQFVAGDMFQSIPPANAVFLKWILHDWGDDECIKILKNCKQAIPSRDAGGKAVIVDIVVGSKPSDTKLLETQVLCDLNMMKVGGAERDEQEWKKLFLEAGFKDYNIMPVLGLWSIIEVYP
ncbi:hypothetical protein BDA96_07G078000 [Sorghum bicolor]|uniref:O-methyltransferase domain-containing protein n=1 Tax=Sorghum bicolor TaxID=4558 RepID=A0A921QJ71_SORBI|nr:hypothetical protein BDA96_07G078000 [Sorghum bicolor]